MTLVEWSAAVKARDGRCVACNSVDDLHAHHVLPKATHPELKYEVSNGLTLCYRCHKAEHARNRVRTGAYGPQRKTLLKRIEELEETIRALESENRRMRKKVGECERGVCRPALRSIAA
jgi:cytochrome c553